MEYISKSEQDTNKIAEEIVKLLKANDVLVLSGDLGAGKTTFTKGLAKAMGINEHITSPTFTLINEYHSGKLSLYHFDMYRIDDESEVEEMGLNEYFYNTSAKREGVCVIEWAENILSYLPKHYKKLTITKLDETSRKFEYSEI